MEKKGINFLLINILSTFALGTSLNTVLFIVSFPKSLSSLYKTLFIVCVYIFFFTLIQTLFLVFKKKNTNDLLECFTTGVFLNVEKNGKRNLNYVNPSLAKLFDTSVEALEQEKVLPAKFWENPRARIQFIERLNTNHHVDDLEAKFKTKSNKEWWGRIYANKIIHGKTIRIQGTITDITQKREFEKVLHNYNENLEREILRRNKEIQEIQRVSILGLSKITEYRDPETGDHIVRMAHYSKLLSKELSKLHKYSDYITPRYVDEILISSPLHDIG
ncbi:MAG: hypothetical protein ABIA63_06590, partial [bacterium]